MGGEEREGAKGGKEERADTEEIYSPVGWEGEAEVKEEMGELVLEEDAVGKEEEEGEEVVESLSEGGKEDLESGEAAEMGTGGMEMVWGPGVVQVVQGFEEPVQEAKVESEDELVAKVEVEEEGRGETRQCVRHIKKRA